MPKLSNSLPKLCLGIGALVVLGLAAGIFLVSSLGRITGALVITGDVAEATVVSEKDDFERVRLNLSGRSFRAVPIASVLERAGAANPELITLIGDDNHTAKIEGQKLEGSYLALTRENGWEFISENFPINTWIKRIKTIVVEGNGPNDVAVIGDGRNHQPLTPGRILAGTHTNFFFEEGRSAKEIGGETYRGYVYTQHAVLKAEEFLGGSQGLAVGLDGSVHAAGKGSWLEASGNRVYLNRFDRTDKVPLAGIILEPPSHKVTDLFDDVLRLVRQGEQVLVIVVDGFGWHQYLQAAAAEAVPHILSGRAQQAISVFPPVTNCGMAAMLTGQTPEVNGIHSRKDRVPQSPSLLEVLAEEGRKGVIIEGNINILQLSGEVDLNSDRDGDGLIDDDILECALQYLGGEYDFVLVHFHSVDDYGHNFGPLAAETQEQLKLIDSYVGRLLDGWSGRVIVLADHGMHETDDGGDHGLFRFEDMYIPYIFYD